MIGFLRGQLVKKNAPQLLLDVNGVGYEIQAPMSTFYQLPEVGTTISLHTHFQVREDSQTLFGFYSEDERKLFRNLIKISGVGAKLALAILSGMNTHEFIQCIGRRDVAALVRLPGIGKKTAERLLVEMADRIKDWAPAEYSGTTVQPVSQNTDIHNNIEEALSALIALGFKAQEASRMVRSVENAAELGSEEIIRMSLSSVAGK